MPHASKPSESPHVPQEDVDEEVRRLCGPLLPNHVDQLEVKVTAEVYRARIDEVLDTEAEDQPGRVARRAIAWDGPSQWHSAVSDGAVDEDLPLSPMLLPEGYRSGVAAIEHLPRDLAAQLDAALDGWARDSGGIAPPHRIRLWRERVALAEVGSLKVWVGLSSQSPLLVLRQRTSWHWMRGAGITVLAGVGAGGFGLALNPFVAVSAFVLGSCVAGATTFETLRRRYQPLWSHQAGD